jgi:glycosyltransferase involved in cell wall biosynthesis
MHDSTSAAPRVAVLMPCYNEAAAISRVVADFRAALPSAAICVYDNNSTDGTLAVARAAGARVGRESAQGKGHVVRRMFADVEADVYVMVDGDATYDGSRQTFLWGLDPTYSLREDPDRARMLEHFRRHLQPLDANALTRAFHSHVLVLRVSRAKYYPELAFRPFRTAYRDDSALVVTWN